MRRSQKFDSAKRGCVRPTVSSPATIPARWLGLFTACWMLAAIGCSSDEAPTTGLAQQAPSSPDQPESPRNDPKDALQMVFQRYRNTDSYFDRGRVDLVFRADGETESRTAPLSVSFHQGELNVSAYANRITHDPERGLAWFTDPTSQHWGNQVLVSRGTGRRPNLDRLLADPVLTTQLSVGGAGPPPQLEWLFSAEPMARLFGGTAEFAWGVSEAIDGVLCTAIRVHDASDRFTFWIDLPSSLIRRIDLPSVVLPMSSPSGVLANREIALTVRLVNASFESPDVDDDSPGLPRSPQWVRRLVPPPNEAPDWTSWRTNDLELVDSAEAPLRSNRAPGLTAPFLVLVGLPSKNDFTQMDGFLNRWAEQMPDDLRSSIDVGLVFPNRRELKTANRSRHSDEVNLFACASGQQSKARFRPTSVAIIRGESVEWMQPGLNAQSLPLLGSVLADLASGIDVRQRVLDQAADARRQFRSAIDDASIQR